MWSHTIEAQYAGHDGSHDGSLATPLVLNNTVFGVSPSGKLFAVSATDGKQRWCVDMPETLGIDSPFYGFGGSPIAVGDTIVVQAGAGWASWRNRTDALLQALFPLVFSD